MQKQGILIKDQSQNNENIEEMMKKEKKVYEIKEIENKKLYDDFKKKNNNLQKNVNDYRYLAENKNIESENENKKTIEEIENNEIIKMKVIDIEHQNEFLIRKILETERKLKEVEIKNLPLTYKEKLEIISNRRIQSNK